MKGLQNTGQTINSIIRETGFNWRTVATWCGLESLADRNRVLPGSGILARYEGYLSNRWKDGEKRGRLLLEEVRAIGYQGSTATFFRLLAALRLRREAEAPIEMQPVRLVEIRSPQQLPKPIDPRTGRVISPIVAAALCMKPRSLRTVIQVQRVAVLECASTDFGRMRSFAMRFRAIMRAKGLDGLDVSVATVTGQF